MGNDNWFRSIMGNVFLSFAGGLAVFMIICLFAGIDGVPRWIWVIGLVIAGVIAWLGDKMRTRKIHVDESGKVKKNEL